MKDWKRWCVIEKSSDPGEQDEIPGKSNAVEHTEQEISTDNEHTDQEVFIANTVQIENEKKEIESAKKAEIDKWIEERVFEVVDNCGQETLSTTWVITRKEVTKARLVVRGYEEEKCRSDSPTCSKDHIRLLLCLAVGKNWSIHSLDVKAAFLQGVAIERDLFILPPKDFRTEDKIWKLR